MMYDMEPTMDDVTIKLKSWWKSFTIWANTALIALAAFWDALPIFGSFDDSDNLVRWVIGVIAAAMVYTRVFRTNQAITEVAADKPVVADKVIVK